jgi:hypothetical protein
MHYHARPASRFLTSAGGPMIAYNLSALEVPQ